VVHFYPYFHCTLRFLFPTQLTCNRYHQCAVCLHVYTCVFRCPLATGNRVSSMDGFSRDGHVVYISGCPVTSSQVVSIPSKYTVYTMHTMYSMHTVHHALSVHQMYCVQHVHRVHHAYTAVGVHYYCQSEHTEWCHLMWAGNSLNIPPNTTGILSGNIRILCV